MDERPTKLDVLYGYSSLSPDFAVRIMRETWREWMRRQWYRAWYAVWDLIVVAWPLAIFLWALKVLYAN